MHNDASCIIHIPCSGEVGEMGKMGKMGKMLSFQDS